MSEPSRPRRFLLRWGPIVCAGALVLAAGGLVSLTWFIASSAHETGRAAQLEHPGDEVEALIAFIQSDQHSLRERNRAVWALGQLRDPRGLSTLQRFHTGEKCQHDKFLCQYELRKAIALCSGSTSAPGWLTRLQRFFLAHA